jgi:bifunctional non-homologous end joining protein LigD
MLASSGELPRGPGWAYELKWDGVRALGVVRDGILRLYARTGAEVTKAYPELQPLGPALRDAGVVEAVIDGEIVLLDREGRPDFVALAERMHVRDTARARKLSERIPVDYLVFDLLAVNGTDITRRSYVERRELLEATFPAATRWSVPPSFPDGAATMAAAVEHSLEGVVAKRLASPYRPGVRAPDWIKVKNECTGDYVVGGWHTHRRTLSGLLVGLPGPEGLVYRGRVGGGISAAAERDLLARLTPLRADRSPFAAKQVPREDTVATTWVRPELVVEVRYGNITRDGRLRFPRYLRLRPDKTPEEAADA